MTKGKANIKKTQKLHTTVENEGLYAVNTVTYV